MVSAQLPSSCWRAIRKARPRAIMRRTWPESAGFRQPEQGQRRVERLGRRGDVRPPAAFVVLAASEHLERRSPPRNGGRRVEGTDGQQADRGFGDGYQLAFHQPEIGAIDGGAESVGMGRRQAVAGQERGEGAAVGGRRSRCLLPVECPGSVGGLVDRHPIGGPEQDRAIGDPAGPRRGGQGRREGQTRQPLVAERAVATVTIPARRPGSASRSYRPAPRRERDSRRGRPHRARRAASPLLWQE